jgi:acetyl esterase/lipase
MNIISTKLFARIALACLVLLVGISVIGCSPSAPAVTQAAPATQAPAITETIPVGMPPLPEGEQPGGPMPAQMPETLAKPIYSDVAYASVSEAQKLDLYLPEGSGPFPLVIAIHGGGFMMGDKASPDAISGTDQLLANGFAVASINYRLSGEALAPAQIQDVKAAVRFLRANADTYNLNPEKIGAWGGSAGGSLAALLGTSCGAAELEGADLGNADRSSCVQAVVDWYGPIDFLKMDEQFAGTDCPANHNEASSPESQLIGGPIQENPDLANLVNAITYVSPDDPAFFLQHGTADCNVPPAQGQLFHDALVPAIGADKVTLTFIEGAGHGGLEFVDAANMQLIVDFLSKYLK